MGQRNVEFGLDKKDYTTTEVVELLPEHPRRIKLPFVVGNERAVIARPHEKVFELVDYGATIGAWLTFN